MSCVCDVGVANMNGCVGLQEPSVLEMKLAQFGPAKAGDIADNNSIPDPIRTIFFTANSLAHHLSRRASIFRRAAQMRR
jgi:hypothetical protein